MRRFIVALFAIALIGGGSTVFADEISKRQLAEDLLVQLGIDKYTEIAIPMIAKMQENIFKSKTGDKEKDEMFKEFSGKLWELIRKEMSWENMKDDYIKVYSEVFTEDELKELIIFYKSPIGLKFIEKTPLLMQKTMEISQVRTKRLMPEINRIVEESVKKKDSSENIK